MQEATAQNLATALEKLEEARLAFVDSRTPAVGEDYFRARDEMGSAMAAATRERDLEIAGSPAAPLAEPGEPTPPPPAEASPGVALVAAPSVAVDATNIDSFGPLAMFVSGNGETEVEATPYAFAEGTAVASTKGVVALAQPSRVLRGADGLAPMPNDLFLQVYGPAPEPETVSEPPADQPATPPEAPPAAAQGDAAPEPGGEAAKVAEDVQAAAESGEPGTPA